MVVVVVVVVLLEVVLGLVVDVGVTVQKFLYVSWIKRYLSDFNMLKLNVMKHFCLIDRGTFMLPL